MSVARCFLALALVLSSGCALGAAAELGPLALTGVDYARARRTAEDLVQLAARIEGQIRAAVAGHFAESEVDVELLGADEVKVLLKVHTREMAYPEVTHSLEILARTINQEVLGKHYRNLRLSPSSALVVLNRREGSVPEVPAAPIAAPAPALRVGGRLADLARRLRERAQQAHRPAPPRPLPGDPGPIAAAPGQVLPGAAGLAPPRKPEPEVAARLPARPAVPEPLVLPGAEGLGDIPEAAAPPESLLQELARIDEPGLPVHPQAKRTGPRIEGEGMTFVLGEHLASLGAPGKPEALPAAQPTAPAVRTAPPISTPVAALLAELSEVEDDARAEGFALDRPLPLPKAGPPPPARHLHASVPVRFRPRRRPPPRRLLPRRPPPRRQPVHPVAARRQELERDIFEPRRRPRWEAKLPPIESVPVPPPPPGPPVKNPPPPPFTPDSPQACPPPRPPLKPGEARRVPRREPTWSGGEELAPEELEELADFSTYEAGFYLGDGEQAAFCDAVDEAWVAEAF